MLFFVFLVYLKCELFCNSNVNGFIFLNHIDGQKCNDVILINSEWK